MSALGPAWTNKYCSPFVMGMKRGGCRAGLFGVREQPYRTGLNGPTELNAATPRRGTESSAPNRDIFPPNIFLSSNKALKIPFSLSIQWSQSALQMLIRVKPHKNHQGMAKCCHPHLDKGYQGIDERSELRISGRNKILRVLIPYFIF